jgi:hypothetical protein
MVKTSTDIYGRSSSKTSEQITVNEGSNTSDGWWSAFLRWLEWWCCYHPRWMILCEDQLEEKHPGTESALRMKWRKDAKSMLSNGEQADKQHHENQCDNHHKRCWDESSVFRTTVKRYQRRSRGLCSNRRKRWDPSSSSPAQFCLSRMVIKIQLEINWQTLLDKKDACKFLNKSQQSEMTISNRLSCWGSVTLKL